MLEEDKRNIVVCGYPKSGSTWVTRLTAELLNCPAIGYWTFKGSTLSTEGTDRISELQCYKSHEHYEDLIKDKKIPFKIIYVLRDPRDMIVSGMFHFNFQSRTLSRFMKSLSLPSRIKNVLGHFSARLISQPYKIKRMINMLSKGDPVIPHCQWPLDEHLSSFINKPDVLFIQYENLLTDSITEAQKILKHCGVSKSTEEIQRALFNQSFNKRKEAYKADSAKSKHLRKGISGDWVNYLSEEQRKRIENGCQHEKLRSYYAQ